MSTRNKIPYYLIASLIAIILLQRSCYNNDQIKPKDIIVTDTIWKTTKDTVFKTVNIVKKQYIPVDKKEYKPGESIDTCKTRFNSLLKDHLARTIYSDTLQLDSLGTIVVRDTVWQNKLYGKRKYIKDYKIPFVTKTITKREEPRKQVYIGGNAFIGNQGLLTPGLIYKDRKDRVYQANLGVGFDGSINYGFGMYWKINLRGNGNK
jgi:hypothetical protein